MKRESYIILLCVLLFPVLLGAQSYKSLWKKVEKANEKSLPQTAIQWSKEIYKKAEKENNIGQLYKAGVFWFNQQMQLETDSLTSIIVKGENKIQELNNPVEKALMHSLLADLYLQSATLYGGGQRTALDDELPLSQLESWSNHQFIRKILEHSEASIVDKNSLLEQKGKEYTPFVEMGETSRHFDHDLYHLLVRSRIDLLQTLSSKAYFYTSSYNEETLKNKLDSTYSELLQTYKEKNAVEAQVFILLAQWNNKRITEQEASLDELNQWIKEFQLIPEVIELYKIQATYLENKNPKQALSVCNEALSLHPNYYRINTIKQIKDRIQSPEIRANLAAIVYPNQKVELAITHKNIDKFKLQWYLIPPSAYTSEQSDEELLTQSKLYSSEDIALRVPTDYKSKDTLINIVAPPVGRYLLKLRTKGENQRNYNPRIISSRFRVLNLSLESKVNELTVLDGLSGHPIVDADVSLFTLKKEFIRSLKTDEKGQVIIHKNKPEIYYYTVSKGEEKSLDYLEIQRGEWFQPAVSYAIDTKEVKLLTDRAIYRPGQTVYIKGISYTQDKGQYRVLANQAFDVAFYDASQKELGKQNVMTNEFGSFTTNFQIPSVTLNGLFLISTQYGTTSVRVEEYKRPSFELMFDTLKTSYQLGDNVTVKGTAKTFTGLPITVGEVNYTLTRSFQMWRFMPGRIKTLAKGNVNLNEKGQFEIPIELLADREDPVEGYYTYTLEVSLKNEAGETQTQTYSLSAGNRSLFLNSDLAGIICKDQPITTLIQAMNLNQSPVSVKGKIMLYKKEKETKEVKFYEDEFQSNETLTLNWKEIPSDAYKMVLWTEDNQNREVRFEQDIHLFSLKDKHPPVKKGAWLYTINPTFDEKNSAKIAFGTAEENTYVLYHIFSADERVESKVLGFNNSFEVLEIPYLPSYKEGLIVTFSYVKNGETFYERKEIKKKVENNPIIAKWEVFRDRLKPGEHEEWRITLLDKEGKPVEAEFLALMYDTSLDNLWTSNPIWQLYTYHLLPSVYHSMQFNNRAWYAFRTKVPSYKITPLIYDSYYRPILNRYFSGVPSRLLNNQSKRKETVNLLSGRTSGIIQEQSGITSPEYSLFSDAEEGLAESLFSEKEEKRVNPSESIRANFAESAFFYPQLKTNEKGEIVFSFTVPEQLTRWNFKGYAHSKTMNLGKLFASVVTTKDFSIQPYYPRFVRQGDQVVLSSVVTNQSENQESGEVKVIWFDPVTEKIIQQQKQRFAVQPHSTIGLHFTFNIPSEYAVLGCRVVANGQKMSDGEQQVIPVLSRKTTLVESQPFVIRDQSEQTVSLDHLFNEKSQTATDKKMTLEFSGNPTWFAIQALPALQQPSHENAITWVAMLYANGVSSTILNCKPQLKAALNTWKQQSKGKEDFLTPLLKNKELKNILIEESPWLLEAQSEEEQWNRLQTLFDLNQVANNRYMAELRLKELQLDNGSWSWFSGMSGSRYITSFVLESLVRLQVIQDKKGTEEVDRMIAKAFHFLRSELQKEYQLLSENKTYTLSNQALDYLYLVALGKKEEHKADQDVYNFFLHKVSSLLKKGTIGQKARAAYVLNYNKKSVEAEEFMKSLKEHLVQSKEKGMYFSQLDRNSSSWDQQKIASHVYALESFDEVSNDQQVVNEMKLWLLSQKRTQQWNTPIETVNAVYALLFRGRDDFSQKKKHTLAWDKKKIEVQNSSLLPPVSYLKEEIPENGKNGFPTKIKITQENKGIAWGAVYAQYQEELNKIQNQGLALKVEKKLYVERWNNGIPTLQLLTKEQSLEVGDIVVSRLVISTDRSFDFVHLKDQRAACFEPIEFLSGYRWGETSNYYLDVKDASTHYFFDFLPKGVQVVEHRYRVARAGEYEGGIATLQSAYTPEFTSYAASQRFMIKQD